MKNETVNRIIRCNLLVALWLLCLITNAQTMINPDSLGKGIIYLKNNQVVKNIRIHKIGGSIVEFQKEGNLHDRAISEIDRIEFPESKPGKVTMVFEHNQPVWIPESQTNGMMAASGQHPADNMNEDQADINPVRKFKVKIKINVSPYLLEGVLLEMHDSSVTLYKSAADSVTIDVSEIQTIIVKRRGVVMTYAMIGSVTGMALSAGSEDNSSMGGVVTGFITGAEIGAIANALSTRIHINGKMDRYVQNREKLNKYSKTSS